MSTRCKEAFSSACWPRTPPAEKGTPWGGKFWQGLPESHPFRLNPHLRDHEDSDAGFHDLLLHARDRAYSIDDLVSLRSERAGLGLVSCVESARYDPQSYLAAKPRRSPSADQGVVARAAHDRSPSNWPETSRPMSSTRRQEERRTASHGRATDQAGTRAATRGHRSLDALARQVLDHGRMTATFDGVSLTAEVPKASGAHDRPDEQRTERLGQISFGEDWMAFSSLWGPVHRALTGFNLLHYSDRGAAMTGKLRTGCWIYAPYTPFMDPRTVKPPGSFTAGHGRMDGPARGLRRPDAAAARDPVRCSGCCHWLVARGRGSLRWNCLSMLKAHLGLDPGDHASGGILCLDRDGASGGRGLLRAAAGPDASGEYKLVGAILCFPSRWLLSEKLGRPLTIIHDPVPDYDDTLARTGEPRVFEVIDERRPMVRCNWLVHSDPGTVPAAGAERKARQATQRALKVRSTCGPSARP